MQSRARHLHDNLERVLLEILRLLWLARVHGYDVLDRHDQLLCVLVHDFLRTIVSCVCVAQRDIAWTLSAALPALLVNAFSDRFFLARKKMLFFFLSCNASAR